MVFDDMACIAPNIIQGGHSYDMICANKKLHVFAEKALLDNPIEAVSLFCGPLSNPRFVSVTVNLRCTYKSDARVVKISEGHRKKIFTGSKVNIYLRNEVV